MKPNYWNLLTKLGFVALLYGPSQVLAQNISLGSAANFAVLGGSTVTNTGTATVVNGDLGVWPGTSITGFPPGIVNGTIHQTDAVAQQAQTDLTAAYIAAAGRPCGTTLTGSDLGSVGTLGPGVYCFANSAQLTGNLTLSGAGVYIFKIGSALTTASGSSITLTGGADPCGVWWQVTSSATLGTTTSFVGNILALSSITLNTNASVNGRILARTGAVTLDGNHVISACFGGPAPPVPSPTPNPNATPTPTGTPATPTPIGTPGPSPSPTLPSAVVPTISGWAMIAFGGLLAMVAFAVIRRLI
jgi:Ice-binding-like